MGKNITTSAAYPAEAGIGGSAAVLDNVPRVPRGFTAFEFPTEGSPNFLGFTERSSGISGYALLSANVTLSGLGDVYFAMQPVENRRGRVFISLGTITRQPTPCRVRPMRSPCRHGSLRLPVHESAKLAPRGLPELGRYALRIAVTFAC